MHTDTHTDTHARTDTHTCTHAFGLSGNIFLIYFLIILKRKPLHKFPFFFNVVSKEFDFTPRCFAFDSLHGYFQEKEITSTAYHPEYTCPFPILQIDMHDLSQPG